MLIRNHPALFYGVYSSYEEASADIPASLNSGWDTKNLAQLWTSMTSPSFSRLLKKGLVLL